MSNGFEALTLGDVATLGVPPLETSLPALSFGYGLPEAPVVAEAPVDYRASEGISMGAVPPAGLGRDAGGLSFADVKAGLTTLGDVAKTVLPIAQLGATGYGISAGVQGARQLAEQTKIAGKAQRTQQQLAEEARTAAAPAERFAETEFRRAAAGQIDPAIQAEIDRWRQGARQQALDYLARAGLGDSSTAQEWLAWIDQQAEAMKADALQQEERLALTATGVAGSTLGAATGAAGSAGGAAAAGQANLTSLIAQANQQVARLAAEAA